MARSTKPWLMSSRRLIDSGSAARGKLKPRISVRPVAIDRDPATIAREE